MVLDFDFAAQLLDIALQLLELVQQVDQTAALELAFDAIEPFRGRQIAGRMDRRHQCGGEHRRTEPCHVDRGNAYQ